MIRTAIITIMVLAPSLATAQGIVPLYYPDGSVYWRRAPMQSQPQPPPVTRQQYITAPPDIVAPERPRGLSRSRSFAPPIDVIPLDPLPPEPTPTETVPGPPSPAAPIEREPNLAEWCAQAANSKAPMCRNVGSPRVQR